MRRLRCCRRHRAPAGPLSALRTLLARLPPMEGQCALISGCVCRDRILTLQSRRSRILILLNGSI
jgi:hypothetical protein